MNAFLILQMVYLGTPYQHVKVFDKYEYLNLTACYNKREEWRDQWEGKAEIVYLNCLEDV